MVKHVVKKISEFRVVRKWWENTRFSPENAKIKPKTIRFRLYLVWCNIRQGRNKAWYAKHTSRIGAGHIDELKKYKNPKKQSSVHTKPVRSVMNTRYGRSDRIRTCGIDVPNAKKLIFYVILRAFRGFLVRIDCFRVLFAA